MAVHHPQLLDFSAPPTALPMEAPPLAFNNDDGLLGLHVVNGADMPAGESVLPHRVLAADDDTAAPWPHQAVSLYLFNYSTAGASLVGHHQPFTAAHQSVAPNHQLQNLQPFQLIRSSKYLGPVKDLLGEFCSLEGDDLLHTIANRRSAPNKAGKWDDVEPLSSGLWGSPSLSSMDLMELERRKVRLLSMVEEVDRRYRRYREQIRSVEASFEAVAGAGAAQVYTRLALRAMSRHFRCLRDALVAQVRKAAAMGENNVDGGAAPAGASKGDTPRLKVLDQCLRQQRAFQQHHPAVDNYPPWRPQRGLPERAVAVLRAWLFEHFLHPYPNDVDKHILSRQTGLSRSQVSNWFINARVRLWKPMIEEMYTEEVKQSEVANQNPSAVTAVVKTERNTTATSMGEKSYQFSAAVGSFNNKSMNSSSIVTDGGDHLFHNGYPNLHGSHSTVSLTLGLQQQSFASLMMQQQRSAHILEGDHEQQTVLPYRNLMASSQSLHDFQGSC